MLSLSLDSQDADAVAMILDLPVSIASVFPYAFQIYKDIYLFGSLASSITTLNPLTWKLSFSPGKATSINVSYKVLSETSIGRLYLTPTGFFASGKLISIGLVSLLVSVWSTKSSALFLTSTINPPPENLSAVNSPYDVPLTYFALTSPTTEKLDITTSLFIDKGSVKSNSS